MVLEHWTVIGHDQLMFDGTRNGHKLIYFVPHDVSDFIVRLAKFLKTCVLILKHESMYLLL